MIEFKNVSFKYNESTQLLDDVNLKIEDGEIVLLCGESGCGKSTLLRMINALIPNYYKGELKGSVRINGIDTVTGELYKIAEQVSSVFQNPKTQFYNIESNEEMVFSLENRGISRSEMEKRLKCTVDKLGMEKLLERNLFAMSGGEKQKVACACADTAATPIIVLDEPSSNLDLKSIEELAEIIGQWKKEGKTVVVAEHRLYYMLPIADRVIYMKEGKIESEFTSDELIALSRERISEMGLRSTDIFNISLSKSMEKSHKFMRIKDFSYRYKGSKEPSFSVNDLTVPQSSIICIIGDNGAGKSTFARTLCGLDRHAKGALEYDSRILKRKDRLKKTFMVMQDTTHQLFTDEVSDELRSCAGADSSDSDELISNIIRELNLTDKESRHPQSLSGGEKQRVAIGTAMVAKRDVIVFDEPTSGLDYKNMTAVADILRKLKASGKTVFIVTHDPELIAMCCDAYIRIGNGRIIESGEMTDEVYREWLRGYK
ncbi:MAG: ABC transporter ATP-binding protein [Lachnospiraceae bacterium]|nr:ABC transporter ATP-binding protein [Lachnospiraceae bacterium]